MFAIVFRGASRGVKQPSLRTSCIYNVIAQRHSFPLFNLHIARSAARGFAVGSLNHQSEPLTPDSKLKNIPDEHESAEKGHANTETAAPVDGSKEKSKKKLAPGKEEERRAAMEPRIAQRRKRKAAAKRERAQAHQETLEKTKEETARKETTRSLESSSIRSYIPDGTLLAKTMIDKLLEKTTSSTSIPEEKVDQLKLIEMIHSGTISEEERLKLVKKLRRQLLKSTSNPKVSILKSAIRKNTTKASTSIQATDKVGISDHKLGSATADISTTHTGVQQHKMPRPRRSRLRISRWPKLAEAKEIPSSELGPVQMHKGGSRGKMSELEIKTIVSKDLELTPIDGTGTLDVPVLSYGLERVLFNPGVYHLQDPRSRVFNFDPYLQKIMPINEFDFNALKQYVTSSEDEVLLEKARAEKKKYTGSTSSMTSALGHFHFLLSQWRQLNTNILSQEFPIEYNTFTVLTRAPSAVFLRWKDGAYAIDADKQFDTANILSLLGKSMEKLFTLPTHDYEKYKKENSGQISLEERNKSEEFHYTTIGDFLLRSQLDAHDPRLPGTGMFDLKTRAVVAVRMNSDSPEEGRGYQIRRRQGEWQSFEREYYDMIRSAFLKYSLQVRMGRMDGIFVAFHNTERIFGFQYINISEMDYALHGSEDTTIGDSEFRLSLELLNRVLDKATATYPEQSLHLHFETRESSNAPFMYIFAEPLSEERIEKLQARQKDAVEEFENRVFGLEDSENEDNWETLQSKVEEAIQKEVVTEEGVLEDDEIPGMRARDLYLEGKERTSETVSSLEDHLDKEGNLLDIKLKAANNEDEMDSFKENETAGNLEAEETIDDPTILDATSTMAAPGPLEGAQNSTPEQIAEGEFVDEDANLGPALRKAPSSPKKVLAMTLTIRNKVDDQYVTRPNNLNSSSTWDVEYALAEVSDPIKARRLYASSKLRRKMALIKAEAISDEDAQYNPYVQTIREYSRKGREWRDKQNEIDAQVPTKVLDIAWGKAEQSDKSNTPKKYSTLGVGDTSKA